MKRHRHTFCYRVSITLNIFIYYLLYFTPMVFCYSIYYDPRLIYILYLLVDIISLFHRSIYISMNHLDILRIVAVNQQLAIHCVRSSKCERASDIQLIIYIVLFTFSFDFTTIRVRVNYFDKYMRAYTYVQDVNVQSLGRSITRRVN